jgi:hypothetical protein
MGQIIRGRIFPLLIKALKLTKKKLQTCAETDRQMGVLVPSPLRNNQL